MDLVDPLADVVVPLRGQWSHLASTVATFPPKKMTRQVRWRMRNIEKHRVQHADYMRRYRSEAIARNAPVTASDTTTPVTMADV